MIQLEKVTKRFGPKVLFENVSMQFDPGKRYGLTGANGAGKSTIIKVLAGEEETDQGAVNIPQAVRLGVLRQNHFAYDEQRNLDAVLMGNKVLWDAMAEKDRLLAGGSHRRGRHAPRRARRGSSRTKTATPPRAKPPSSSSVSASRQERPRATR